MNKEVRQELEFDYSKYGFRDPIQYLIQFPKGLSEETVLAISRLKNEPKWMTQFRLKAYKYFKKLPAPKWGPDISGVKFDEITYYVSPTDKKARTWDEVPEYIKKTFDRLGIPEAERRFLAGVGAQYDSEVVYHSLKEELEKDGVVFLDTDTGLKEYPEIFQEYFGTVVPPNDNKFAALNSAVWSGGSFIYVPKGVKVKMPLQAYFRINAQAMGQFERTLIILEPKAEVTYIEGCTAPIYASDSLHAAVVEVIAKESSKVTYITVQNWSKNVYNLVTKRGHAYRDAYVRWIDGNIGSKVTMKYPSIFLKGEGARGEVLSIAYASRGQHIDSGAKAIHLAPNTTSRIINKSICKDGGRTTYRGLVHVTKGIGGVKANVVCEALILDDTSQTDTYPYIEARDEVDITHEAKVGKVGEEQIYYLMSRGLEESEALNLIVMGFIEEFIKELPFEYAIEFNRLIQLDMEGAVG